MVPWKLPLRKLASWVAQLAAPLDQRVAGRLTTVLLGMLFARGRRTVASWLRAVGVGQAFPGYYYLPGQTSGRKTDAVASALLRLACALLAPGDCPAVGHRRQRRPNAMGQRSRARSSTTIRRRDRPTRSSSTATSGFTLAWLVRHPRDENGCRQTPTGMAHHGPTAAGIARHPVSLPPSRARRNRAIGVGLPRSARTSCKHLVFGSRLNTSGCNSGRVFCILASKSGMSRPERLGACCVLSPPRSRVDDDFAGKPLAPSKLDPGQRQRLTRIAGVRTD